MSNFYITTPIYYVNDLPHIGHAYTTIACDIITRYQKLHNNNVYFLTGTDEHGQKVEKAAQNLKKDPKTFSDEMSVNFNNLVKFLNCEINDFIRTTEKRHKLAVQHLWNVLLENDQIYLGKYEGWYSVRDESFYTENELKKVNGKFIAPTGAEVEWVKEDSYFFKLSKWQDKLLDYYNKNPNSIAPKSRFNEVISFIKGGLKDLSVSRTTFSWGVPVPNDNKHITYVWIDALTNYITALGYPNIRSDLFNTFWPGIHIVGKDILKFHAIYWPAFLMAANLKPPIRIFAHGWWTNEGNKISKSLGNVIDPYEIVEKFGLDQIRFFLFREVPFGNDGDFSNKAIISRINADLSNNYGNLIQRTCTFINKNFKSIVENNFNLNEEDKRLLNYSKEKYKNYSNYLDKQEIDKSIKEIIELLSITNIYFDKQAPWKTIKDNLTRTKIILSVVIEILRRSTIMLNPIIPESTEKVFNLFNLDIKNISFDQINKFPKEKYTINKAEPIFPRIEND